MRRKEKRVYEKAEWGKRKRNPFRNSAEELQGDWKIKMEGQRKGNECGVLKKNNSKRKIVI